MNVIRKNTWTESENIFEVVRPLYRMSRLFGICPYTINNDRVIVTQCDCIAFIAWLAFYIYILIVIGNSNYENTQFSASELANFGPKMTIMFGSFVSVIILLMVLITRNSSGKIVRQIYDVDIQLSSIGITLNYQKQKIMSYKFIAYCFIELALALAYSYWYLQECGDFIECVNIYLPFLTINISFVLFMSQFLLSLIAVKFRFRKLNEQFRFDLDCN